MSAQVTAQFIVNNGKPAFAVIPIAEYERLLTLAEDRIDIKAARRVAARIASGDEETLPAEFVAALIAGKTQPLRLWRQHRGLTLDALGKACGVTRSALSQIESGKTKASGALLKRLAKALDCEMDDLA
jgi:DNA-binding XRE family transcriptional regulator